MKRDEEKARQLAAEQLALEKAEKEKIAAILKAAEPSSSNPPAQSIQQPAAA
jgi:hypothetical protein